MTEISLPELPPPALVNTQVPQCWFTADQMMEFARDAVRIDRLTLLPSNPAASEGDGLSRIHAMFRALGFDGLEALPGWGWSYSRSGCAVEAMIENGILLEHFDDWVGFRPTDNTSEQPAGGGGGLGNQGSSRRPR